METSQTLADKRRRGKVVWEWRFGCHNHEALQPTLWWLFHSTSDSEPGKKARNCAGAIWSFKLILKQAEKSWFGWQKEGARLAKDWKVRTSTSLIRKYLPREQSSAHSNISRFSKVTVLNKPKLQPTLYFWPETTTLGILNALGTRCRLSAKTKLANSFRKQPKSWPASLWKKTFQPFSKKNKHFSFAWCLYSRQYRHTV